MSAAPRGRSPRPGKATPRPDGPAKPGLAARVAATRLLGAVIESRSSLDGLLDIESGNPHFLALPDHDRLLVRAILLAALRHLTIIDAVIDRLTDKPLPGGARALRHLLAVAVAQILYLDVPDHAVVDLAVTQANDDPRNRRFASLVNAVLRRLIRERGTLVAEVEARTEPFPAWFAARLRDIHGPERAKVVMAALQAPPPLDLTVKSDPHGWAERLGGIVLPTGTVRLPGNSGAVTALEGFGDGEWWVQDAAAAIPARLFGGLAGKRVADLCAAPGGKTAQLILAGGTVTAFDQSANRLKRLQGNLARLGLSAETRLSRAQDVADAEGFDAVLLDAPCSSTGTVRRHPDIVWTKSRDDVMKLAAVQRQLLDAAAKLVRPGGSLVFSNCSADPEEGEDLVSAFLAANPAYRIAPVSPADWPGLEEAITERGEVRTDAAMLRQENPLLSGLDGFYAVVLVLE